MQHLLAATEGLRRGGGRNAVLRTLTELRHHLAILPHDAAVAAILAHLKSGKDAPTGLKFGVGPDGNLTEASSLRMFLLDYLAQVDPAAAAESAQEILSSMNSPDEWAVALRNFARVRVDAEGKAFLEQKMHALLTYEPWTRETSVGFLEAFDVAVHLGGTSLVPELTALARKTDNRAAAHAAYLALDRLTIAEPLPMLTKLADEPDLLNGREVTRANLFARADVGEPGQRRLVENYLLNPKLSGDELNTFSGLFPNANYMISPNLLTRVQTPDGAALAQRDLAALQVVEIWLADSRFQNLKPQLGSIKKRLESYVKQAGR